MAAAGSRLCGDAGAECASGPGVAARPLIEPEIAREIALVTVRGRAEPAGLGALVREVMRMRWPGDFRRTPSSQQLP